LRSYEYNYDEEDDDDRRRRRRSDDDDDDDEHDRSKRSRKYDETKDDENKIQDGANNKVYVGNIPYSMTTDDLYDTFGQEGRIIDAIVKTDVPTGRSRGFGIITFQEAAAAEHAIENWHNKLIGGRPIVVRYDRDPASASRRSGGRYNNDYGISEHEIRRKLIDRERARMVKDYGFADQIRSELSRQGITVNDMTRSWRSTDGRSGPKPSQYEVERGSESSRRGYDYRRDDSRRRDTYHESRRDSYRDDTRRDSYRDSYRDDARRDSYRDDTRRARRRDDEEGEEFSNKQDGNSPDDIARPPKKSKFEDSHYDNQETTTQIPDNNHPNTAQEPPADNDNNNNNDNVSPPPQAETKNAPPSNENEKEEQPLPDNGKADNDESPPEK